MSLGEPSSPSDAGVAIGAPAEIISAHVVTCLLIAGLHLEIQCGTQDSSTLPGAADNQIIITATLQQPRHHDLAAGDR